MSIGQQKLPQAAKVSEMYGSYKRNPSRRREEPDASSPLSDPSAYLLAPSSPHSTTSRAARRATDSLAPTALRSSRSGSARWFVRCPGCA